MKKKDRNIEISVIVSVICVIAFFGAVIWYSFGPGIFFLALVVAIGFLASYTKKWLRESRYYRAEIIRTDKKTGAVTIIDMPQAQAEGQYYYIIEMGSRLFAGETLTTDETIYKLKGKKSKWMSKNMKS